MLLSAQDLSEKAEIQLLQSDKYMGMALELAKKGKHKMTVETMTSAEEMFMEVPIMLEQLIAKGEKPRSMFIEEAVQSNISHRQAIEEIMKNLPQGNDANVFHKTLKLNEEVKRLLEEAQRLSE